MPTRQIKKLETKDLCTHPEHNPPMFRVFDAGIYEHECPNCGNITNFTVTKPRF